MSPQPQLGPPLPPRVLTPLAPSLGVIPLRSPTLPPATHTNAWVLGEEEVLVVDPASPWPGDQAALRTALAGRRVRAIVLTHHHVDHRSGVEDLQAWSGAPVWAHADNAPWLPFPIDRALAEGERLEAGDLAWRLLWTPGHAHGHLCLHEASQGLLIAGDMVAGEGTIVLDPPEGHLATYLDSLQRLLDLGCPQLLPAHGRVITDGPALLAATIAHRHQRSDQVRAALGERGPARAEELVPRIYPELPPGFQAVAARQVLCHLLWLQEQGELEPASAAPLDAAAQGDDTAGQARWAARFPSPE